MQERVTPMKKLDLLAVSALALIAAMPAHAQDAGQSGAISSDAQDARALQDAQAGQDANAGDEIVVTATKRETTLLETPVAVSVASAETIERAQIRDLIDLQTVVPSLRVAQLQTSANTNFIIRGFGNGANNAGIEPSVGVFIDGVYRSRSAAQIADLPNLERVEVLRGPQSTLFGKNASAGIISIVTARPSFDWQGSAEASYGNYNAIVLKGFVSGPIAENVAFSLAGNYNKRDGYIRDEALDEDVNNRNRWGVRGQLLFEPSSDFSIRIIGDYDKIDENCCAVVNVVNGPTGAIVRGIGGNLDPANPFSGRVYNNRLSTNNVENYGVSGQIDFNLSDGLSLTSISAYRGVRLDTNQDSDFTSADLIASNANTTNIDTFSQELRLTSSFDGPFNFLLGGYYFNEKIDVSDAITFGRDFRPFANANIQALSRGTVSVPILEGLLAPFGVTSGSLFGAGQGLFDQFDYKNEAISAFGQIDFEPVDGLTFTAGLNYTDDRKRVTSDVTSTDVFSRLDLVQIGFAQALSGLGVNPASPAAIGAFAAANPAAYAAVVAGAQNPAANPLLALRALQFLPPFLNFPNAVENGRTRDDNLSYTLRASYKLNRNLNVYATYATGFKASSFNLSRDSRPLASDFTPGSSVTNPPASPIRTAGLALPNLTTGSRFAGPEEARVIELGLKAQFTGFAFNLALFDQRIDGFQSNAFTGTGFSLANAPQETIRGIELDTRLSPSEALTFNFAMTYLDAKYDDFPNGAGLNAGYTYSPTNLTGTRPGGIPEFTITVGGDFTQPLSDGLDLLLHADFNHQSDVQILEGVVPISREINLLNGSLGLRFDRGIELSVWGRNLTNDRYLQTIFPSVAQSGSLSGYPNQPRTYGVTGRYRF